MNRYQFLDGLLELLNSKTGRGELVSVLIPPATTHRTGRTTIDDVLEQARGGLSRLTSAQARKHGSPVRSCWISAPPELPQMPA
jgi:hypothetical protein